MKLKDYREGLRVVTATLPLHGSTPDPISITQGQPWRATSGGTHYLCEVRHPDGRVRPRALHCLQIIASIDAEA